MCEVGVAVEVPNRGYFGAELGSGGCFCLGRPNLCIRATSLPRLLLPSFTATAHCTPGRVCLACHEADSRRSLPAHGRYCMRHRRRHQCCECARATGCVWVDWTGSKAFVGDVSADTSQREPQPQRVLYPCTGPHATQHTCIQLRIAWLRMRRSRSSRGQCGGGLVEASEAAWK